MGPRLVLLNGPPSAGKSSVGRALRERLEEPFFYSDLDDFVAGYLPRWWDERFEALWDRVVDAWLQSIRGLALAGNDVIAPTMILPGTAEAHFRLFSDFTVYLVAIRCPIEVAQERELRRSDRRRSLDLSELGIYELVHDHPAYDLEVDTTVSSPEEAAASIVGLLQADAGPTAFRSLLSHGEAGMS